MGIWERRLQTDEWFENNAKNNSSNYRFATVSLLIHQNHLQLFQGQVPPPPASACGYPCSEQILFCSKSVQREPQLAREVEARWSDMLGMEHCDC